MVAAAVRTGHALRVLPGGRQRVTYAPRGAAARMLESRDFEVLSEGPVGTGKSYGVLWKMHLCAIKYPGMKGLLLRKTQTSLTASAVATYTQKILPTGRYGVRPFSGNIEEPAGFRYPNGSKLVVGGMDKASKVMSTEYDLIAVFEATELTVDDWESATTRLRNYVMPYQQIIADCNPGAPTHWLNQRANEGIVTRLLSRHRDNPLLWDADRGEWTERGIEYVVRRLGNLTGVRRLRLLEGKWAAAEGQVYEQFDQGVHLIDRFDIPRNWPRYWVIDFGFVHPFVWQWWAEGPDGVLIMYREIYMTRRLVEDHAKQGLALSAGEPAPLRVLCDHDAEDRATFERHAGVTTTAAYKLIRPGIQAVAARLDRTNGKPRLLIMRDSLVEVDQELKERGLPLSTVDEFGVYVWPDGKKKTVNRDADEVPVKEFDHGMDGCRYMVADVDLGKRAPSVAAAGVVQQSKWSRS